VLRHNLMDIWTIARSNDLEALKKLFAKGIGLRARDDKGMTLLHHAAEGGALNIINYLLERGIEVDAVDSAGFTALHRAVMAKKEDAAIELIKHGANPSLAAKNGTTIADLYPSLSPRFSECVKNAQQEWAQMLGRRDSLPTTPIKEVTPVRFGDRILYLDKLPSANARTSMSAPVSPVARSDTATTSPLPMTPPPNLLIENSPPTSPSSALSSSSSSSTPSTPSTPTTVSQSSSVKPSTSSQERDNRRRATTVSKAHSTKDARSSVRELTSSSYARRRNSTVTARTPLTKSSLSEVPSNANTNLTATSISNLKTNQTELSSSSSTKSNHEKRATTIGVVSPGPPLSEQKSPKKSKSSHDTSKKSSHSKTKHKQCGNEVVTNVNIDDITDALCKIIKVTCGSDFGTPQFDMKKLFEEIKLFSAGLRLTFVASKKFAAKLKDKSKATKIIAVSSYIEETLVKELLESIKKITADPKDTSGLRVCLSRFTDEFWKLYTSCESISIEDIVLSLQTTVIWTRKLVKAAEGEDTSQTESFEEICDVVASEVIQLTSLILEHSFANFKSPELQHSLYESCHVVSQASRGLLLAAIAVRTSKDERAQRTLTLLLKKIAEQVRVIALHIKPDPKPPPIQQPLVSSNAQLFDECVKILSNAKDRYYVRSPDIPLMNEEKELLLIVAEQIEQIKHLKSSYHAEPRKKDTLIEAVLALTFSLTKVSQIVHPICVVCSNSLLADQLLLTLESLVRCSIQMKLLTCSAVHDDRNSCLSSQVLGYVVRAWGSYMAYLLEATYKALH